MDTHVVNYLDAQHCLAIAASFIAIIAACATLINGANNKAESLTNRIHEVAREFREVHEAEAGFGKGMLSGIPDRCNQIKQQLDHYDTRFRKVQHAQRLLFLTISIFITCLAVFIGLGLYMSYFHVPDVTVYPVAGLLFGGIGLGVLCGTGFMLWAITLHFKEVWQSYNTLYIEIGACQKSHCHSKDTPQVRARPSIDVRAPQTVGSQG